MSKELKPASCISHLCFSHKSKYTLNSTQVRIYDFSLRPEQVAIEKVDMNSFWLCCGKDPLRTFGGAWLLAPGDRIIATQQVSTKTRFDPRERKTYLRLWFVESDDSLLDLRAAPALKIRVALTARSTNDLFMLACGKGELFGSDYDDEDIEFDERLLTWPWMGNNHGGIQSGVRWRIMLPFQQPQQKPPPPQHPPSSSIRHVNRRKSYNAESHLQQVLNQRSQPSQPPLQDKYGRPASFYGDIPERDYEKMAIPTGGGTAELYDPLNPGM